jgi:glycosyltransferase involved in cell wall biosynthesis
MTGDAQAEPKPKRVPGGRARRGAAPRRKSRTKRRPAPEVRKGDLARTGAGGPRARLAARRRPRAIAINARAELEALSRDLSWRRPSSAAPRPPPKVPQRHLHVVMAGWEFPPIHAGGLGVHCYELCKELTRMGHHVTFLTPFRGPFEPVEGVTFRYPGGPEDRNQPYPGAYASAVNPGGYSEFTMNTYNEWVGGLGNLEGVDVVHVHDWFATVGARQLARRLSVPLVMTMHSTEYDRTLGHPWGEILHREEVGLGSADRVIAVSRHLKQQLTDRYRVPGEKVRVIYNAVRPPERLAPLQRSRRIVLYLGRLAAMKGVDTFLRSAARVAPGAPDALFVVAGEGPEFPRLLTLSAHLGISDQVLFLGHVTEEERSVLLASASVFVLPSVVEPFGIAALEAMAAGVPTIISKTSGVAEITESVFAVDFWDIEEFASRIAELLEYPALRDAMSVRGRWDAVREGWAERALETVGVYAELLEPTAAPA